MCIYVKNPWELFVNSRGLKSKDNKKRNKSANYKHKKIRVGKNKVEKPSLLMTEVVCI